MLLKKVLRPQASKSRARRNTLSRRRSLMAELLEDRRLLAANEIAFVDPTVWGQTPVPEQISKAGTEVVVLDSNRDGIQQMADYLRGRSGIDAINIISHGDVGEISPVGNTALSASNISEYASELSVIGSALSDGGDILVWGCSVAGLGGSAFVDALASATGADVAASEDLSGSPTLGGDWELEYATGPIGATNILSAVDPEVLLSHFRGGTLNWQTTSGNTVKFDIEQSWRRSFFGSPGVGSTVNVGTLRFGDGTWASINITVASVNTAADSFTGSATISHTYPNSGTYTAFFQDCCRISPYSGLQNNADGWFRTETVVTAGTANDPPVSSMPPIVSVADNHVVSFAVPANDPNGDALSYRLATSAEAAGIGSYQQPPGMSIDASTGIVTWDIRNNVVSTVPGHLWSSQVMITDTHGAKTPVDFMIRITSASNLAPTFDSIPASLSVVAGNTLTFSVEASDPDSAVPVSLQALNAPAGMTFTPVTPTGASSSATRLNATWTPPLSAAGSNFVLNFTATDNNGVSSFQGVSLSVTNQTPVAANDGIFSVTEDGVLTVDASSGVLANDHDPDVGNPADADSDGTPDYLDADPNSASNSTNVGRNGMIAVIATQPSNGTVSLSKDGSFTYVPAANFAGTDTFIYVANDGFGSSAPAVVTIEVTPVNDPPVADAGGPYAIDEGDQLELDASSSMDVDGDALTYAWDLDGDGSFDDATGVAPVLSWTQLPAAIRDDGVYTVRVRVDDGNGAQGTAAALLTISNVAPTLEDISLTPEIFENGSAILSGDIIDPGTQDTFTLTVDWGDGSDPDGDGVVGETFSYPAGTAFFSESHRYLDDGPSPGNGTAADSYPVRIVSLSDDDGGVAGTDVGGNIFLTGHDVLLHGHQGGFDTVILDYLRGAGTPGEILRGDYDILYLRTFDQGVPGGTGPGFNISQFGTVIERDANSFSSAADFASVLSAVDVLYVPWIFDITDAGSAALNSYAPQIEAFINAGGDVAAESSFDRTNFYDFLPPSAAATGPSIFGTSGFTATAAGSAIGITGSMINGHATHNRFDSFDPDFTVFETRGSEVISIGIRNAVISDGGIGSALSVLVKNVAPDFNAGPNEVLPPAQVGTLSRSLSYSDPGTLDVWSGTVDFGDGSGPQSLAIDQSTQSFNLNHTYSAEGTFTVSVTVEDDDLGSTTRTFDVTVDLNNPPTAADSAVSTVEDTPYSFAASDFNFSDADPGDALEEVQISTLPSTGTLYLDVNGNGANDGGAETLAAGDNVAVADIDAGRLRFEALPHASGNPYDSFTFRVSDGEELSAAAYEMTIGVTAVADPPMLDVEDARGNEDTAIPLVLDAQLVDTDGSESLTVVISGIPDGAVLSDGANTFTGSSSSDSVDVSSWDRASLTITPASHSDSEFALSVTATAHEGSVAPASSLTIAPASPVVGNCFPFGEGHPPTGSDPWTPNSGFVYKNIPAFDLAPGDILAFDLGRMNDHDIRLDILMAATTVNGGDVAAGSFVKVVSNSQVAAAPRGDTTVGNFELQFVVEDHFSFAGGGLVIRFTNPAGTFATDTSCDQVLVSAQSSDPSGYFVERFFRDADGLHPYQGIGSGSIGGFRVETAGGDSADVNAMINVRVDAVADAPNLAANASVTTNEDQSVNLGISSSLVDTDGSESLTLSVSGAPTGAVLSDGPHTATSDGVNPVDITGWSLGAITVMPPANDDSEFQLTIAATSSEDNPTSTDPAVSQQTASTQATVDVRVDAVADAPNLAVVGTSSGFESAAIPLAINSSLNDIDGSESLLVEISGVPAGAILNQGTDNGGGSWTLTPAELAGLTISVPDDAAFTLTVTTTATESSPDSSDATIAVPTASVASQIAIAVDNVKPTIDEGSLSNAAAVCGAGAAGDPVQLAVEFSDPGFDDPAGGTVEEFTLSSIDWGDGTTETVSGSSNVSVSTTAGSFSAATQGTLHGSHIYADGGIYAVTMTVRDDDGGEATISTTIVISGVGVMGDTLYVIGTAGDDQVSINQTGNGLIEVHASFLDDPTQTHVIDPADYPAGVNQIHVILCDGDDHATIAGNMTLPAILDGGAGDDHLKAGRGGAVFLGGDGNDTLIGGAGNDIMIGGIGTDRLVGGPGEDAMVGGHSSYESHSGAGKMAAEAALLGFLEEWGGTADRADRQLALDDLLDSLMDDEEEDKLTGASDEDWFLRELDADLITDLAANGNGNRGSGRGA